MPIILLIWIEILLRSSFDTKGEIFERCSVPLSQIRLVILEALYGVVVKLVSYIAMKIMAKVISKVAEVMEDAENVGIRIDWLDRLIR